MYFASNSQIRSYSHQPHLLILSVSAKVCLETEVLTRLAFELTYASDAMVFAAR